MSVKDVRRILQQGNSIYFNPPASASNLISSFIVESDITNNDFMTNNQKNS